MKVIKFEIKPLEGFILRTSLPFGYGAIAYNLAPYLPPTTAVGALRAIFAEMNLFDEVSNIESLTPKNWRLGEILIKKQTKDGGTQGSSEDAILYYPTPADLMTHTSGNSSNRRHLIATAYITKTTSFPTQAFQIAQGCFTEGSESDNENQEKDKIMFTPVPIMNIEDGKWKIVSMYGEDFVCDKIIEKYLLGELDPNNPESMEEEEFEECFPTKPIQVFLKKKDINGSKNTIGYKYFEPKIKLDQNKTVEISSERKKGGYFNIEFFKFNKGFSYLVTTIDHRGASKGDVEIKNKVFRFGGEGKLAKINTVEMPKGTLMSKYLNDEEFIGKLVKGIQKEKKVKFYAVTPIPLLAEGEDEKSIYSIGCPPKHIEINTDGGVIRLVLRSYMIRGEVYLSGWAIRKKGFKPGILAAAPGSVFYYEIENSEIAEESIKEMVEKLILQGWNHEILGMKSNTLIDFFENYLKNIYSSVLIGVWREENE